MQNTDCEASPNHPKIEAEKLIIDNNNNLHLGSSESAGYSGRIKLLCCPIKSFTIKTNNGDSAIDIVIIPESFRMWFYWGFLIFTVIAMIVSTNFADQLDLNDNIFVRRWGGNNICIFFDYPPFSWFGSTLWFPQVISALLYEIFDQFRVYDSYIDHEISKRFYILYTISTVFESFAFIFFSQVFATSPDENIYLHTIPFILLIYALWTMAFKRFMYIRNENIFKQNRLYLISGWIYVLLLLCCVIGKTSLFIPNLFEAYIFKQDGFEWTIPFLKWTVYLWFFLTIFFPMIIYFVLTKDLKTITLNINRTKN